MSMQLQIAQREKVKIKMSLSAPTGFGKTYGALLIAYGITNDWSKIAVIDSENQSASLYSDLGKYYTIKMEPPYTVEKFCQAVDICVNAGIEVVIVDSTYHYWHGKGGLLEFNNSLGNNSYTNWMKTNPVYNKWLDKILQSPVHVICTSRKKQAYEMTKDGNGKVTVEKKGMEDQVRDGFSYEMTISFNIINKNHLVEVDKDRTQLFTGKPEFVITSETGAMIKKWCDTGIDVVPPVSDLSRAIAEAYASETIEALTGVWSKWKQYQQDAAFIKAKDDMKAKLNPVKVTDNGDGTTTTVVEKKPPVKRKPVAPALSGGNRGEDKLHEDNNIPDPADVPEELK